MMKRVGLVLAVFILIGSSAPAMQTAVIGGIRDGLALGLILEDGLGKNVSLRGGIEANTGKQPLILFFGGKFYLTNLGRKVPLSFGLGFVGYSGNKGTDAGLSVSFIFERIFEINPLFFEVGVDVAGPGRLQAQMGYKIY